MPGCINLRVPVTHAFRHTFLNRAFNLDVQNAEVITGHAGSDSEVVRGYKGKLQVKRLLSIIEQVDFDIAPIAPVLSRSVEDPVLLRF